MRKKDLIEFSITVVLIIVLIFAASSGIRRVKSSKRIQKARPVAKEEGPKKETSINQALSKKEYIKHAKEQNQQLYSSLEKEAEKLELVRDPFSRSIIRPTAMFDTRLNISGILWDERDPRAIINGRIVGEGDKVDGNTVISIEQDLVVLNDGLSDFILRLER